ncbi:MAG: VWA domain-containing protein [Clostridia bacterium]|nr:VWA domain-containing protein [Clostridia bacterium]
MRKGLTEMVFILDRSGSMGGREADTIGGFNSFVEKQQALEGEAYLSTILFDDVSEVLMDRVDLKKVEPIGEREYWVRGCTALLDALGDAIHHIKTVHRYAREEDRPEKTVFVITTDGLENASHKYSFAEIRSLITRQQEEFGWEFLFLGAGIDAIASAASIGIRANRAARYSNNSRGIYSAYEAMGDAMCCMRMDRAEEMDEKLWAKGLVDDEDDADDKS